MVYVPKLCCVLDLHVGQSEENRTESRDGAAGKFLSPGAKTLLALIIGSSGALSD